MADGPLSMSMDDPELMRSLGMPASPVTGAGQDPDEMRAMMPAGGTVGQPEMVRPSASSAQAAGAAGGAGLPPVPPSQVPSQTDPSDIAKQALTSQLSAGNRLMQTGDQMQDDPAIVASEQKLAADRAGMPNAADPQYKPSFGTRVLRGLKGAAEGFAHGTGAVQGALDPKSAGATAYGAPNDAYDVAQGAQEKKIAGDTEQQGDLLANFKRSQDALKNRESAYNEGSGAFDKTATAGTSLADLPNKTTTANADMLKAQSEAQKVALETPEAKDAAQRTLIAQRTNQANMDATLKRPGYLRSRFILTGEFQPEHDLNAADVEQAQVTKLTQAWQQQNPGKKPGFEDLQKIYQSVRSSGAGGGADRIQSADLRKAADLAGRHLKTLQDNYAKYGLFLKGPEKTAAEKEINDALDEAADLQRRLTAPAGAAAGGTATPSPPPGPTGPPPAPGARWNPTHKAWFVRSQDGKGWVQSQ